MRLFLCARVCLTVGAYLLLGCEDSVAPNDDGGRRLVRGSVGAGAARQPQMRPWDDEFATIGRLATGFGGVFVDSTGRRTAFVLSHSDRGAIQSALTRVLGDAGEVRFREGTYDFLQLEQWHRRLRPVLGITGVAFTDIDERENRLRIGLYDRAQQAIVERMLTKFRIPREAVLFELSGPVRETTTLSDFRRPTLGGLKITRGTGNCTLGANAESETSPWDGVAYFLTAAHCTEQRGELDNSGFYQPIVSADNFVGYEVKDPPLFTGGECPSGRVCSYTDVALIRYTIGGVGAHAHYPGIVRTLWKGQDQGSTILAAPDAKTGWGSPDKWEVVNVWGYNGSTPLANEPVDKVGISTGWTGGPLISTCRDVNFPAPSTLTLLCQGIVDAAADDGDSGAAAFRSWVQEGSTTFYNADLYGIVWGNETDPSTGFKRFLFSPMPAIMRALGPESYRWCYC